MKTYSRNGLELRLIARAATSDANASGTHDSVWARRVSDGALRCYYLHELRADAGAPSIVDFVTTLPVLGKQEASAVA